MQPQPSFSCYFPTLKIEFGVLAGKSAEVPEDVIEDWVKQLPDLIKDIFSADEQDYTTVPYPLVQWISNLIHVDV